MMKIILLLQNYVVGKLLTIIKIIWGLVIYIDFNKKKLVIYFLDNYS